MNFLQIKQVLAFIYTLQINFCYFFSYFHYSLDWASNTEKCRGPDVKCTKTQATIAVDRGLNHYKQKGSFASLRDRRGIDQYWPLD
jgi:hypothetical protein